MYYSDRSLFPKNDELCVTMETHNPDICFVETRVPIYSIVRLPYLDISYIGEIEIGTVFSFMLKIILFVACSR